MKYPHARTLSWLHRGIQALAASSCLIGAGLAQAEFAAAVSPPRFEVTAQAGTTSRQVIEVNHVAQAPGSYKFYTADWSMGDDGAVKFHDTMQAGSCRPWVAIERSQVNIMAGARLRYRMEVTVPPDTPDGECRFALMIEGAPDDVRTDGLIVPMSGRVGVIAYVRVGNAKPNIQVLEHKVVEQDGRQLPAILLSNAGLSTARPDGFLKAVDGKGSSNDLTLEVVPILPGHKRWVTLSPAVMDRADGGKVKPEAAPKLQFPLRIDGVLDIGPGQAQKVPIQLNLP